MRPLVFLLIVSFVVVSDQWTKYLAESRLTVGGSIEVIPGFFDMTLVYNPGAAFGMFGSWPDQTRQIALWSVSALALAVLVWFIFKEAKEDRTSLVALSAIFGGAAGNLVDRFRFDAVVDFIDIYVGSYHWPAFNVADSAISVGVVVLLLRSFAIKPTNNKIEPS
jgi:signal peptidase II